MFDKKQFKFFIKRINQQKKRYYKFLRPVCPIREWYFGLLLSTVMLLCGGLYIYNVNVTYSNFDLTNEVNNNIKTDEIFKKRSLYNALSVFDKKEARLQKIMDNFNVDNKNDNDNSFKEKPFKDTDVNTVKYDIDKSTKSNHSDKNENGAVSEIKTPAGSDNGHNDLMPLN